MTRWVAAYAFGRAWCGTPLRDALDEIWAASEGDDRIVEGAITLLGQLHGADVAVLRRATTLLTEARTGGVSIAEA